MRDARFTGRFFCYNGEVSDRRQGGVRGVAIHFDPNEQLFHLQTKGSSYAFKLVRG